MNRILAGWAARFSTRSGIPVVFAALTAACGSQGSTPGDGTPSGSTLANDSGGRSSGSSGSPGAVSDASAQPDGTVGSGADGAAGSGALDGSGTPASSGGTAAGGDAAAGDSSTGGAAEAGPGPDSGGAGPDAGGTTKADASTPPVACQAPLPVTGTALAVSVDLATVRATVGSDLMGIYSAVYDNSFRAPTTPPALQAAGVRSIRYPGGSYADVYHWSTHTASIQNKGSLSQVAPYVAALADFGSFVGLIENVGASGIVTVNYGSNPQGTGPGVPEEAAAWVAYANGSPSNTAAIGIDATGTDWKTVGYWASLRAASPLPVDDGQNFLRIAHTAPVGIKYWEVGNELYGNGFYYGGEGWEEDLHLLHDGTPRKGNPNLSPVKYGQVFPTFAQAMKAVDPAIKVGAILHWPYNEYAVPAAPTDWNASVLTASTCAAMDFGIDHWYAGTSLTDLLTRPRTDIPAMYSALQAKVATLCPSRTGTLALAVTEWGPNYLNFKVTPPAQTQIIGVFAADAYANFMEQGALNVDWLEIHNNSYLGATDTPTWGYHGQQMAGFLANGGDAMVRATVQAPPAVFTGGLFQAHASKHADGSTAVMLVNTSPSSSAAATVSVTGLPAGTKLPCVGTLNTYSPLGTDSDGIVTSGPVFSTNDANNRVTVAVPAYSVVVVTFPKN